MTQTEGTMRIKSIRLALGLTQEELAHRLGVTGTTIHRWECGKTEPHKVFRKHLAKLETEVTKAKATA